MHHLHSLLEDTVDTIDVSSPTTMTFRAPTVDEALDEARSELGPDVEILEANRIRRGGVGGFFATDLGVEITVTSRSGARSDAERATAPHEHPTPQPTRRDPHFRSFDELAGRSASAPAPRATSGSAVSTGDDVDATVPLVRHDLDDLDTAFDFTTRDLLADDSFARHMERELSFDHDPAEHDVDRTPPKRVADFDFDLDEQPDDATKVDSTPAPPAPVTAEPTSTVDALRARDPRSLHDHDDRFDTAAFASFVERELATDDAATSRSIPRATSSPAVASTASPVVDTPDQDPTIENVASSAVPTRTAGTDAPAPSATRPARRATTLSRPRRTGTVVEPADAAPEVEVAAPAPAVAPAPALEDADGGHHRAPSFDRPAELVADAVNRLVDQLSHTAPVDGSRVHQLRRVQVTLTTSEGDVVQMAAELGAD